jgi:CTP:molybdopterin cytidylyltransferase MocA
MRTQVVFVIFHPDRPHVALATAERDAWRFKPRFPDRRSPSTWVGQDDTPPAGASESLAREGLPTLPSLGAKAPRKPKTTPVAKAVPSDLAQTRARSCKKKT